MPEFYHYALAWNHGILRCFRKPEQLTSNGTTVEVHPLPSGNPVLGCFDACLVVAFGIPRRVLSTYAIQAGYTCGCHFAPAGKHLTRVGAELHVRAGNPALQLAMLMRPMERTGDDVAHLA
jgi:hypothetical protein